MRVKKYAVLRCDTAWDSFFIITKLRNAKSLYLCLPVEKLLDYIFSRALRIIFGPKRDEVTVEWRKCTMRNFIICTLPQISLGKSSQGE
jgi:hypothetical protein